MAEETKDRKPSPCHHHHCGSGRTDVFCHRLFDQQLYPSFAFGNIDFTFVIIFSVLSQGMSSMTTVTRLLFVMGRTSLAEEIRFHPSQIPHACFQHCARQYHLAVRHVCQPGDSYQIVNFGALTAFLFVNVSVIFHYIIREKRRTPTDLLRLLCPLLGAGFVFYLITRWISLPDARLRLACNRAGLLFHQTGKIRSA